MQDLSGIKHPAFRDALALTRPAGRAETGRYLAEGIDLVRQALASPSPVFAVYATPAEAAASGGWLEKACREREIPLYILSGGLVAKLVGTGYDTAVTALAMVGMRQVAEETLAADGNLLLLAGERIQDPRNVGVLVRTAEAAGCGALLLSSDSAEPYSRAAVRSTTGSLLRLPLCLTADLAGTLTRLRERGVRIVATSARAPRLHYDAELGQRPLALIVGNETEGISAAMRAVATDFVALPMAPGEPGACASSLNVTVAAGVLLYEALRQTRNR